MGGGKETSSSSGFNRSSGSSLSLSRGASNSATNVWGAQSPLLEGLYGAAQGQFQQGPYSYGQNRVAGMDPRTTAGLVGSDQAYGRGVQDLNVAAGAMTDTASGQYLDPSSNPSLERMRQIASRGLTEDFQGAVGNLGSRMEAAGRTGGGAHAYGTEIAQRNLATGLGDMNARIYGDNYQQERGRMLGAASQLGQVAQGRWQNLQGLMGAGQVGQQQTQTELTDDVARFQFGQDAQTQNIGRYQQMLGGPVMTSAATSEELARSRSNQKSFGYQTSKGVNKHGGLSGG